MIGPSLRARSLGVWMVVAAGCAAPSQDDIYESDATDNDTFERAAEPPASAQRVLPFQQILASMRVRSAIGPGCPTRPSWDQDNVPEGTAFTLMFHQMELTIPPVQTPVTKELYCDVAIAIDSPTPVSWSVTNFQYSGYASLTTAMSAVLGVRYDFTTLGALTELPEFARDLVPPMNDNFAFDADPLRATWSPCATSATLSLRLRIRLSSGDPVEPGLLTLNYVDGRLSEVKVGLDSRGCAQGSETGVPSNNGTPAGPADNGPAVSRGGTTVVRR